MVKRREEHSLPDCCKSWSGNVIRGLLVKPPKTTQNKYSSYTCQLINSGTLPRSLTGRDFGTRDGSTQRKDPVVC